MRSAFVFACLLVAALGCGAATDDTVGVYVAAQKIPQGTKITAEMVKIVRLPKDRVPLIACLTIECVVDRVARYDYEPGDPIDNRRLGGPPVPPKSPTVPDPPEIE